jgi:hypothetical protein
MAGVLYFFPRSVRAVSGVVRSFHPVLVTSILRGGNCSVCAFPVFLLQHNLAWVALVFRRFDKSAHGSVDAMDHVAMAGVNYRGLLVMAKRQIS